MRIGNLGYRQVQHDIYASVILAVTHIFFAQRLTRRGDEALFHRLQVLVRQAGRCYNQPDAADPRFAATVEAVEKDLRHGGFIFHYVERDDFGEPEKAFLVGACYYVNALAVPGRRDKARALFERVIYTARP